MANFIIQPTSVSYAEIRADIVSFFEAQNDSAEWALFLKSSGGTRMIDLHAIVATFMKMETIIARREGFLQFAVNRSSIVGKAQDFGYSAYRGRNRILKLNVTPSVSGVWQKYTNLGSVKDKYLVLSDDVVVNAGTPIDIDVIVGEVKSETLVASTAILNSFRFTQPNVSEDIRVFLDSTEMVLTKELAESLDGKFFVQSNTFGSVDAKYLNLPTFSVQYIVGSNIRLDYIELKDISFIFSDLKFYSTLGVVNTIEDVAFFSPIETDASIKINAPIKYETGNAVRGREDQPKILKTLAPDILDASGEDVSDAVMRVFLLRDNGFTFSAAEKAVLLANFEKYRPHGLRPPFIENATPVRIRLKFSIVLKPKSTTVPQALVDSVLLPYKNKLGGIISFNDFEDAIENDVGVKIARTQLDADTWLLNHNYSTGRYVKPTVDNGFVFRVIAINSTSGSIEPVWPVVAGNTIEDNQILFSAIPKNDLAGITTWLADTVYQVGQVVKPSSTNGFVYEVVDVLYKSGSVEPSWSSTANTKINDGRIVWNVRPLLGTPPAWTATTNYKTGDIVIATTGFLTVMFQAVEYTDKSSGTEPTWPTVIDQTVIENKLIWQAQSIVQDAHQVTKSQYFVFETEVVTS